MFKKDAHIYEHPYLNAEAGEMVRGPNPREHEELGGVDGARADQHLSAGVHWAARAISMHTSSSVKEKLVKGRRWLR